MGLVLAAGAGVGWWATRPAQVRGREETRQDRLDARFDDAFGEKTAAPPPRTLDAGPVLLDDAQTHLAPDR
ncbi:MAG: hypothetical protein IT383_11570 [Deltaproteobacteria bacterium]|nr:hypothetical protein [Deltaproteobacteria bacterium]